jgi:hypothetical protein
MYFSYFNVFFCFRLDLQLLHSSSILILLGDYSMVTIPVLYLSKSEFVALVKSVTLNSVIFSFLRTDKSKEAHMNYFQLFLSRSIVSSHIWTHILDDNTERKNIYRSFSHKRVCSCTSLWLTHKFTFFGVSRFWIVFYATNLRQCEINRIQITRKLFNYGLLII